MFEIAKKLDNTTVNLGFVASLRWNYRRNSIKDLKGLITSRERKYKVRVQSIVMRINGMLFTKTAKVACGGGFYKFRMRFLFIYMSK